jgi:hypothetical protein
LTQLLALSDPEKVKNNIVKIILFNEILPLATCGTNISAFLGVKLNGIDRF